MINMNFLILIGIISIMLNHSLIWMNVELLIGCFLVVFYVMINYGVGDMIVSMLFNRNIIIFESFKYIFVNNISLLNVVEDVCGFFEILSLENYSHMSIILLYTYEILYINYHNNIVDVLNKLVINVLDATAFMITERIKHLKTKLYITSDSILRLEKNLINFFYAS